MRRDRGSQGAEFVMLESDRGEKLSFALVAAVER